MTGGRAAVIAWPISWQISAWSSPSERDGSTRGDGSEGPKPWARPRPRPREVLGGIGSGAPRPRPRGGGGAIPRL